MSTKPTTTDLEWTELDQRAVDTARVLAMDSVQKVGNGHPGTAMSLAPAAYVLFQKLMRHDPNDANWTGRDRFVLSPGHTSLTLYIQLYMAGYGLELDDLKAFRTWGSLTPGHPEHGHTTGVETTTGPLGQGIANAVGMAMAARYERGLFDPEAAAGASPFDHTIWAIVSDGDLEEGVSAEASSLAGHQKLGNLVALYDDNHISIEGDTETAFSEDVLKRYEAYGWHVQRIEQNANGDFDVQALHAALKAAQDETERPSLIAARTIIAWPAPNAQNTEASHGSALGEEEIAATKRVLGFDPEQHFQVDEDVFAHVRKAGERGREAHAAWDKQFQEWRNANAERAATFDRIAAGELPEGWEKSVPVFEPGKAVATRAASGKVLQALGGVIPELWGRLRRPRRLEQHDDRQDVVVPAGRQPAAGGGPVRPYGPLRHPRARHGLDDERHRAARQHAHLRRHLPGVLRLHAPRRPPRRADEAARDVRVDARLHRSGRGRPDAPAGRAHGRAARHPGPEHGPPGRRQRDRDRLARDPAAQRRPARSGPDPSGRADLRVQRGRARGGYVLFEAEGGTPQVVLIGTGSEVQLAVEAREQLQAAGIPTRVVSMPSIEWFEEQDQGYRDSVLPPSVKARVAVEAGIALTWYRYVGEAGRIVSLEHFGASADAKVLFREFGFTADAVTAAARESLAAATR